MADIVVAVILCVVVFLAVRYIVKERKKGVKCIGCPYSSACGGNCHSQKE